MANEISVREALDLPGAKIIDVRSEAEFTEATIPGAFNIPLLNDTERAQVGKLYKEKGSIEARELGFQLVFPKLSELVRQFGELSLQGPLVVFCWRGGLRSKSVCALMEETGIPVYRLVGGYKAYRRYLNDYLSHPLKHRAVVIHGLTGVGKTDVIQELRSLALPAVDLEGLANNRGSVFGQIGMNVQPSQKMFDGLLVQELAFWEDAGYIIVECESRRIGRIILPETLVESMRNGIKILAYSPIEIRIERIKRIYSFENELGLVENKEELKEAIKSLERRIGKQRIAEFCEMVDKGQLNNVVEHLLINYYDPLYKYPSEPSKQYDLSVDTGDICTAVKKIKDFLNQNFPVRS
ncbi:tRNA 2-selenouridine(34) synthase MnmH [Phosphitispora sp. TUW77]|uniref:tRNA 2-selenouridine(34) synthase MnmH n=1 Tax=Phosphitispora sp. TUW77 TaxID=3152361 RepID=UPI003AB46BFE